MASLPDDVLQLVFLQLSDASLLLGCAPVCRQWHQCLNDDSWWNLRFRQTFPGVSISTADLLQVAALARDEDLVREAATRMDPAYMLQLADMCSSWSDLTWRRRYIFLQTLYKRAMQLLSSPPIPLAATAAGVDQERVTVVSAAAARLATKLVHFAAAVGHPRAVTFAVWCSWSGGGWFDLRPERNRDRVGKLYAHAAWTLGDPAALVLLHYLIDWGSVPLVGVRRPEPTELAAAARALQRAFGGGTGPSASASAPLAPSWDCFGPFVLALCYEQGYGDVARNDLLAGSLLRALADRGFAPAQLQLGVRFRIARGVRMSYAEAEKWARRAWAQELQAAQRLLIDLDVWV